MATTYIVPQVLVSQEFNLAVSVGARRLHAHISAPHAYLLRYAQSAEKSLGLLGYYDALDDVCSSWPDKPTGAVVDHTYTKVFIDNALLQYFTDTISEGDTIAPVANRPNRIRAAALGFTDNGDYDRSAEFLDRDVKVGDIVKIRTNVASVITTLWTYVTGFAYEAVAAVIDAATADDDNADATTAASSYSKTGGADNCVNISASSHASYSGSADGDLSETYTVEVTQASTGGNLTTAVLRVTSASGNDDVLEVTPSASGVATAIGTRGLTVTWTYTNGSVCSDNAYDDEVSASDFIVGQQWQVVVSQTFVVPTATQSGTYTGDTDLTYIVEVTRGGTYAGTTKPQITVTTTDGTDISGPTNITAAATPVAIGTNGVNIAFSQTALSKGDRYYITATAATEGRASTLILGHNLSASSQAATDMDLTLYIKKDVEITAERIGSAPTLNWEASDTELCLYSGITVFDESWTDGGEEVALPVVSASSEGYGKVYVEYRAWRSDLVGSVTGISDVGELDTLIEGSLDPDNPLKYAVSKALANSSGTEVKFTAVADPAVTEDWIDVLELLDGDDQVYGLVPCTHTQAVLDLYEAHVKAQSTPEQARWRVTWVSLQSDATKVVVDATTSSDLGVVVATIKDDPNTSGTQYTLVAVPAGNGKFLTNGVVAGDILRHSYANDGFGNITYTESVIDDVVNEDSLLLKTGLDVAINVAAKIEVWHTQTATERAEAIAVRAGTYDCRRVQAVWPDVITSGGTAVDGYYLCAALAGLASGVVPHQGLTNVSISGFDSVPRTTTLFNRTQLNIMAGSGTWIVTQDLASGSIFSRHAETTGSYDDINQREEMVTRNIDSISYLFMDRFSPYIGISNVTPSMLDIIEAETLSTIQYLRQSNFVQRLGGQLIDGTITELRKSLIFRDRIVLSLSLEIPYPLNNLEVNLVI